MKINQYKVKLITFLLNVNINNNNINTILLIILITFLLKFRFQFNWSRAGQGIMDILQGPRSAAGPLTTNSIT